MVSTRREAAELNSTTAPKTTSNTIGKQNINLEEKSLSRRIEFVGSGKSTYEAMTIRSLKRTDFRCGEIDTADGDLYKHFDLPMATRLGSSISSSLVSTFSHSSASTLQKSTNP